jgi:hypothetical protein
MASSNSTTSATRSSTRQRRTTWKIREQDELIPVVVEPLPTAGKPLLDHPIPHFEPEQCVPFDSMRPVVPYDDLLYLFLYILGE